MMIWSIITDVWFSFLIGLIFVIFTIIAYLYYSKRALFAKMIVDKGGITIKNIAYSKKIFFSWQDIESIKKINSINGIKIQIYIKNDQKIAKQIHITNSKGFIKAMDRVKVDKEGYNND